MAAPINTMAIACNDEAEEGTWTCDGKDPNEWYWKSSTDNNGYWSKFDLLKKKILIGLFRILECKRVKI